MRFDVDVVLGWSYGYRTYREVISPSSSLVLCFKSFKSSGPVSLLSGLNPRPSVLVAHFFGVALFGVSRLLLPRPSVKGVISSVALIYTACCIILPIVRSEVCEDIFPSSCCLVSIALPDPCVFVFPPLSPMNFAMPSHHSSCSKRFQGVRAVFFPFLASTPKPSASMRKMARSASQSLVRARS